MCPSPGPPGVLGSQGLNRQSNEVTFHKVLKPLLFSPNALEGLFAANMGPKRKFLKMYEVGAETAVGHKSPESTNPGVAGHAYSSTAEPSAPSIDFVTQAPQGEGGELLKHQAARCKCRLIPRPLPPQASVLIVVLPRSVTEHLEQTSKCTTGAQHADGRGQEDKSPLPPRALTGKAKKPENHVLGI